MVRSSDNNTEAFVVTRQFLYYNEFDIYLEQMIDVDLY